MAKRKRLAPAKGLEGNLPKLDTGSASRLSPNPTPPIAHVAGAASANAALEELSDTLRRAREEGRMILDVPLAEIEEAYLVRDRVAVQDDEMTALMESLKARGQQTPIELVELGPQRYGLISGWRRCQALRALGRDAVRAIITPPRAASDAYVAMIEENEIRVGLSYFERARIVLKSVEAGVYDSHKTALQSLFSAASRAKRSKIKSFVPVVAALGSALQFPAQLGERLGLQLSKLIEADPEVAAQLAARLQGAPAATVEAEQDMLSAALKADRASPRPGKFKKSPRRISPVHGVVVSTEGSTISLKGTRVDAAFYNDLLLWLKQRG